MSEKDKLKLRCYCVRLAIDAAEATDATYEPIQYAQEFYDFILGSVEDGPKDSEEKTPENPPGDNVVRLDKKIRSGQCGQ
jgi:hypothetical protein